MEDVSIAIVWLWLAVASGPYKSPVCCVNSGRLVISVSMAQSSLVPAREMPRWRRGAAPSGLFSPCGPVSGSSSLDGEVTLFCLT